MRGSNSTVLDTVATAASRSNLFAKLFTQCLQTCECVISSFNVLPNNSTGDRFHFQTLANTTKIKQGPQNSNRVDSMGFVWCICCLIPSAICVWCLSSLLIRHPFGNCPEKDLVNTSIRVPRRLDVCDSVSYCTVVVQDDGCEGSAGLNLPGLKCPLITSGYPARLKSCSSQALWCTGAW